MAHYKISSYKKPLCCSFLLKVTFRLEKGINQLGVVFLKFTKNATHGFCSRRFLDIK